MVMQMEEGLDTGPIAMAERIPIGPDATAGELHDMLAQLGAKLMARAMAALERGTLAAHTAAGDRRHLRDQDRKIRNAHRLEGAVAEGARPLPRSVAVSRRLVRACGRRPREGLAHDQSESAAAQPGQVLDEQLTIACGEGAVRLVELQRAGRQPMSAEAFLRGTSVARGSCRLALSGKWSPVFR